MLSIDEIKNISFRKATIGGYKPEDVDTFIDQVLITVEQLRKEKSDLVKKMDILATRVEEYRADEDAVRNALLSAQKVADNTIKEARGKAARIIEESENLAKAKLYDLNYQIKQQKKQYSLLLAESNRLREDLIAHCNKHIVIAKELPNADKIETIEAAIDAKFPTDNSGDFERDGNVATGQSKPAPVKVKEPSGSASEKSADKSNDESKASISDQKNPDSKPDQSEVSNEEYNVNIVSDFGRDNFDVDHHTKHEKKKSKSFDVLKFGDDYDLDNDKDDDTKSSDNN